MDKSNESESTSNESVESLPTNRKPFIPGEERSPPNEGHFSGVALPAKVKEGIYGIDSISLMKESPEGQEINDETTKQIIVEILGQIRNLQDELVSLLEEKQGIPVRHLIEADRKRYQDELDRVIKRTCYLEKIWEKKSERMRSKLKRLGILAKGGDEEPRSFADSTLARAGGQSEDAFLKNQREMSEYRKEMGSKINDTQAERLRRSVQEEIEQLKVQREVVKNTVFDLGDRISTLESRVARALVKFNSSDRGLGVVNSLLESTHSDTLKLGFQELDKRLNLNRSRYNNSIV